MCSLLLFICIFISMMSGIELNGNQYPVFWNVNEATTPYINVTQYDILQRNYTQVGDSCSTPNCVEWTQGLFPQILNNGSIINGGVPQSSNLSLHLDLITKQLTRWIPDPDWNGNAVLDFEAWTTVWDYNTETGESNWHSKRYQDYSITLAQHEYPNYNSSEIYSIAKKHFEAAATKFFVETLKTCSSIRPRAKWGFYGLPANLHGSCSGTGDHLQCGYNDPTHGAMYRNYSDQQIQIWQVSDIIYPSIYLSAGGDKYQYMAYINSTVTESLRCAKNGGIDGNMVYPYIWQKYHNGTTLLSEQDLNITVKQPYDLGARGLVIWGDAKPTYTDPLRSYMRNTSGPIIYDVVQDINQCAKEFCSSHGECMSLNSTTCVCDAGYSGTHCSHYSHYIQQ
eukprot:441303_1